MKIAGDDDLVTESIQSLFVYLYEKRQSCSEPQSISAYLCVALKRMLLNELKKTANGVFTSLDEVNSSEYRFDYNTTHMAISRLRERLSKSFLLTVAANLWIFN